MKYTEIINDENSLFFAILDKNFYKAKKAILSGADVNEITNEGMTPLMLAAGLGDIRIVRMLCENGADINFVDYNENTALDYALRTRAYKDGIYYCKNAEELDMRANTFKMGDYAIAYPGTVAYLKSNGALTGAEIEISEEEKCESYLRERFFSDCGREF